MASDSESFEEIPSPIDVIKLRGCVQSGFGRGSKVLGIPTANLAAELLDETVGESIVGVYFGWARLEDRPGVYKTVLSIGWYVWLFQK